MAKVVKRGFFDTDKKQFNNKSIQILKKASKDLYYLLNQGYNIKGASTFIGNHYLLSERQRLAITRAICSKENLKNRKEKEVKESLENKIIKIDGFNTIITLEVAFSNSLLIKCIDGTIRDLASLRSTYKIIDKTDLAVNSIARYLEKENVKKVIFYLDAPISNSGELKKLIIKIFQNYNIQLEIEVINNVDSILEKLDNVVTSDSIILDKCVSFINLTYKIINEEIKNYPFIDLSDVILKNI